MLTGVAITTTYQPANAVLAKPVRTLVAVGLFVALLMADARASPPRIDTPSLAGASSVAVGKFKRVMLVVLENASYGEARKQPFLSLLAGRGAVLTNFSAEAHPSQPNYIALIAGSMLGVTSDADVDLTDRHVGDLLEARHLDWRVYAEAYPGNCYLGSRKGTYVRKHVPFLSFENVQHEATRCARIVDAGRLQADLEAGSLPAFALYVPDLNNDGHDTSVEYADKWLATKFGPLLDDPRFNRDLLFIVTFDEGRQFWPLRLSNRVLTILVGGSVVARSTSDLPYSHYSLLRLVEDGLGLESLGKNDTNATQITGIWK